MNPIEMTGAVNRSSDIYLMRNQHENRMYTDTVVNQNQVDKNAMDKNEKVVKPDNADMFSQKFDAKEKGKNHYFNNRKKSQNDDEESDGVVIIKKQGGFDMSV